MSCCAHSSLRPSPEWYASFGKGWYAFVVKVGPQAGVLAPDVRRKRQRADRGSILRAIASHLAAPQKRTAGGQKLWVDDYRKWNS